MLRATSAEKVPAVMQAIEAAFASSDAPCEADDREAIRSVLHGDDRQCQGFIQYTSIAVAAALLCVAVNTMAMSLLRTHPRDCPAQGNRVPRNSVLAMFLSESVLIGLLGGVVGALGGKLIFSVVDLSKVAPGLVLFYVPWSTALYGLALAAVIGLLSGLIPAWRAAHISVIDGLRKIV